MRSFESGKPLYGQTAVITGGSGGIGRAVALKFAAAGAGVVIGYYKSVETATSLVEEIKNTGGHALAFKVDVRERGEVGLLMKETVERFGGFNILVHCVGVYQPKYLIKVTTSDFFNVFDANLKGAFLCMQAAIKQMIHRKTRGTIINISSMLGLYPEVNASLYAAAKAGLIALSRSAAVEYQPYGIRVNVVAPGMTETPMSARAFDGERSTEAFDTFLQTISLREIAKPEDVASAVYYCAVTPGLTGEVIETDGGWINGIWSV